MPKNIFTAILYSCIAIQQSIKIYKKNLEKTMFFKIFIYFCSHSWLFIAILG